MATWAKGVDFKNSANTARVGGVGVYGLDTSASKIYLGLGSEPWNNTGLQITNSTIDFKGNKIYHSGDKPTPADIGAATSNHTHNYLPLSGGTMTGPTLISGHNGIIVNNTKRSFWYHNNQHVTISAGGESGDLYLGFNSGTDYQTKNIRLESPMNWKGGTTIIDSSGKMSWSILKDIPTLFVGQSTVSTEDWNGLSVNGIYPVSNFSGANSPTGAYQWGGLLSFRHGYATNQLYLSHGNNEMWIRGGWNGTYNSNWSRVYTTSYKPSATDIGAAPASHNHTALTSVTSIGGAGASSSWGSLDITGSKSGWQGIHFKDFGYIWMVRNDGYTGMWKNGSNPVFAFDQNGSLATGTVPWGKLTGVPSSFNPAAHNHSALVGIQDTRSTTYTPATVPVDFKVTFQSNNTNGVSDGGSYYSLMHVPRWSDATNGSGGYGAQIAFTDNENMWYRKGTSSSAWGSWRRIWHSGNFDPNSKASSTHNHGLLHDNLTVTLANTTTDSGWSMINGSYNGFLLKSIRTQASTPNWIVNNYGAGIAFGGADTKGVLSAAYNTPLVKFAGGNGTAPVWWIGLSGSSGNVYDLNSFSKTNHTHSYLPLSGGTISGRTIINNNASATAFNNAQLEVTASSSGDARITLHSPGRMYASLCAIGSDIIQIETERSGYIRHKNANGYLEIGPKNTSHCHYTTDRSNHWFNADVRVQGHIYAGKAYNTRIAYADPIWRWNGTINANVTQDVTHGLNIANPLISLTTSLGNVNPTIAIKSSNQVSIYQYGNTYYGFSNQCNYNICIY